MSKNGDKPCGCGAGACGVEPNRRAFLRWTGLAAAAGLVPLDAVAGPFSSSDFEQLVPRDKNLQPQWVQSLFDRGTPAVYRGAELRRIGMPVGGIGAGQIYLGGDGRLWHWDIFNQYIRTNDRHYAHPPDPDFPVEQGFAVRISTGTDTGTVRTLDSRGFADVSFRGEYPIGRVEYRDEKAPVAVTLEAYSPFLPLNAADSALPVTILEYTVRNTGAQPLTVEIGGWLGNAVCLHSAALTACVRHNRVARHGGALVLDGRAEPAQSNAETRPDIVFEDFEGKAYEGWTATGTAFGSGPIESAKMPAYQGDVGAHGRRLVNTHNVRQGEDVKAGDRHTGTLTSKPFVIVRRYVNLLVGGGAHAQKTCVNLLVDGKVVRSLTGRNDNRMTRAALYVGPWEGKKAQLQIVDAETGSWGNIGVDEIVFSDKPAVGIEDLARQPDFGGLALALLAPGADDRGVAGLSDPSAAEALFAAPTSERHSGAAPRGGLVRKLTLAPNAQAKAVFVVAWHMPNHRLEGVQEAEGRFYAARFASVQEVVRYVADNYPRLSQTTRKWRDTWYDSTLPYWFLDRTFANASTLATSTCHWFANGRFYGWEGVGCCPGTCTHVWHYAQAVARLFPELERDLRQRVDFGLSFDAASGVIQFRGEYGHGLAVDGQAGVILRTLREHQMSPDDRFLRRVWPNARRALECLIAKDSDGDGLLDGNQHNTLDADWYGQVAWLSAMYLAALAAGETLAKESGDQPFAAKVRKLLDKGKASLLRDLFNGEYFIHRPDPAHLHVVGSYHGCSIDQVLGQSWAHQVGLDRILPEKETRSALEALWKYNFTPDVGPYRARHKPGRWYAMPGEAGLLMVTYPHQAGREFKEHPSAWSAMYFNECMTGFEHQVAAHMIWEGMVEKGLAIERAIHDRYHPARRNPWNEVECGDHYARALASYGVFLAACGFEYHGPKGHLGFAPRLSPENFRAAFTAAQAWGSFEQTQAGAQQKATIEVHDGTLRLRTLTLALLPNVKAVAVAVRLGAHEVPARLTFSGQRLTIALAHELTLSAGQSLNVVIG